MAIQFQYDGTVAGDEAKFAQPWFKQTAFGSGGKEMDGNLEGGREKRSDSEV